MPSRIAASVMVNRPFSDVSYWMMTASAPSGNNPTGKDAHRFARADSPLERGGRGDLPITLSRAATWDASPAERTA